MSLMSPARPLTSVVIFATALVTAGCQGEVRLDANSGSHPLVAGCPPDEVKCTLDIDNGVMCGCGSLWVCNPSNTKCERPELAPDGAGGWSCSWSKEQYSCEKAGGELTGSAGWTCAHDGELKTRCSRPAVTPNRKAQDVTWECHVYDARNTIICLREQPLISPPEICDDGKDDDGDGLVDLADPDCLTPHVCLTEVCGNGKDDDCDGLVDGADSDCGLIPACVPTPEVCANGKDDDCDGYADCADRDCYQACSVTPCTWKTVDCGSEVKGCAGNDKCHRDWVDQRCNGDVLMTVLDKATTFLCSDDESCVTYRCQVKPATCTWSTLSCGTTSGCTPGDESCFRKWVAGRCGGTISSQPSLGGNLFTCTDTEACRNVECQAVPGACAWTDHDCEGQSTCAAGDAACFKKWVDDRCQGTVTTVVENGKTVYKCSDGSPVCKNYRCEAVPATSCSWTSLDCKGQNTCAAGDTACFKKWVDDRCQGTITTAVENGQTVYKCSDGSPVCKNYRCEVVAAPACTWTSLDCGNSSGCNPGDEGCFKKWVDDRCDGPITVTKHGNNNVYTCADGEPKCRTTTCEARPPTACTWHTTDCHAVDSVGHCNGHLGNNLQACTSAGRGGCSDDELYAWCTRRVPGLDGPGGPWWKYIQKWVEDRCGGPAIRVDDGHGELDMFRCVNQARCEIFTCETPLVLVFDPGAPVDFRADDGRGAFDLSAAQDGRATRTDWPTAVTPWLALDLDHDGRITSGQELFGSATRLGDSQTARNGFEALARLDDNGDGLIDRRDAHFRELVLWYDRNGDRHSDPSELVKLADRGVVSLAVRFVVAPRCDSRGNCERERATFAWQDDAGRTHSGALVDVHLRTRHAAAASTPRRAGH